MGDPEVIETIEVPCISLTQPIGQFYIGTIEARDLVAISFADVRRPEGRDIERYIGTQRDLSEARVAEIRKYVRTVDACFPTSVILAISSEDAEFSEDRNVLRIKKERQVAKIIDGQHRIAGLEGYDGDPFWLNVTVFIDMDLEDQAMVFATINLQQTKVSKSLAYDLYEYAEARSPQKTCHNIAKLLNFRQGSPLHGCIKILGKATGGPMESITQATFVDRVIRLISKHPMEDKDLLKRKKSLERASRKEQSRLVFRNRFIDGEDAQIARILWNYFSAVAATWPNAWISRDKGAILGRTTGFAALVRLLPDVLVLTEKPFEESKDLPTVEDFGDLLSDIGLPESDFTSETYKPGSSGEAALYDALRSRLH